MSEKASNAALKLITSGCGLSADSLLLTVQKLLSQLSIETSVSTIATSGSVVVGLAPPCNTLAAVVEPPEQPSPYYSSIKTTVIRSILPRHSDTGVIPLRDALDVYPASGINASSENEKAVESFRQSAQVAVERAKRLNTQHITVVIKPASKYKRLNDIFLKTVTSALGDAGMTLDVMNTSLAANELLLFPEKFNVVLTNDDPVCENVQFAFASAIGAPATYHTPDGGVLSGGHSVKSVLLGAVKELTTLGLLDEAKKVEGLLKQS